MSGDDRDDRDNRPWIVVVGGFLGAGKTTLILAAARELESRGKRCAVIMNDQGTALVDTRWAELQGLHTGEVNGGCFCCRLSDLLHTAERLRAYAPHVIFAEPVGSCADLVATVLRPFEEHQQTYRIAPFTVLVDPERASSLLGEGADLPLRYLYQKQIEEADLVCFTKADVQPLIPEVSGRPVRQICATRGEGVLAWLNEILSGTLTAAGERLEIDYERYARAEAALAWLNLQASFWPMVPVSPLMILGPLLDAIAEKLSLAGVLIMHLKMVVTSPSGFVKASICASDADPVVEGALVASPAARHEVLLNLRALGSPADVLEIIQQELGRLEGRLEHREIACFSPAAPKPERRISPSRDA